VEIHPGRLDPFVDGTLDQCIERNITPLAWSPLGGGAFGQGNTVKNNHGHYERYTLINQSLDAIAKEYGVSRTVIALAWLLKHPSKIVPIIGSNNPDNIRDSAKADTIDLTRDQWYKILLAARGKPLP
jgi:predicted oxidoreductase